ncbi:Crp/Fnr family transcriptional regulator [Candidatus Falkowbacteria bacterium]|nr:Crp/Fnr family transcriptional regulator [Candidatus Falkowbacteria bacterium]
MSKTTSIVPTLKQVPLFNGLSEEKLEEISKHFTLIKKEKKVVLYIEGDNPDCLTFLTCGSVKATSYPVDGEVKRLINVIYLPGDFFAESSLEGKPLPFDLETREYSIMLRIKTADFRQILESNLDLFWKFLQQQATEKLELNRKLGILSQADAKERIIQFLVYFYKQLPTYLPINLTHEEIGELCGMARETVTRVLGALKKTGQIKFDGRRIIPCV